MNDRTESIDETPPTQTETDPATESSQDRHTVQLGAVEVFERHDRDSSLTSEYEVIDKIGAGGMGVVYLGRDKTLGRYVAIKRLKKDLSPHHSLRTRFFTEAKAIAALSHPHIVHIYELGEDRDGPYIVMEYIPGPRDEVGLSRPAPPYSLSDRIHREGPMQPAEAITFMLKVCRAVEYAHSQGVIHRDLKPPNILLRDTGEPKLVDFGLARLESESGLQHTMPGERMLTLGYGAPEQEADASTTDERADVYSLAALLYFTVSGKNPRYFRESDLPDDLVAPMIKALETNKARRWESVTEFIKQLEAVTTPTRIEFPATRTTWRCKWCDAVNPVEVRYCARCGWDGGEHCPECREDLRVGEPYCSKCGADMREYENAIRVLSRLSRKYEQRDYEGVLQAADRLVEFKPSGSRGRELLRELRNLESNAQSNLQRCERLKSIIPDELSRGEYELAYDHILEYRTLGDPAHFAAELSEMPAKLSRQLVDQVERLMRQGNVEAADALCLAALEAMGPTSDTAMHLQQRLRKYRVTRRIRNLVVLGVLLAALYVMSAPPLRQLSRGNHSHDQRVQRFFSPARILYRWPALRRPLDAYAALWTPDHSYAYSLIPSPPAPSPVSQARPEPILKELSRLKAGYTNAVATLELGTREDEDNLRVAYREALMTFQADSQQAGDFDNWLLADEAVQLFDVEQRIPEADEYEDPGPLSVLRGTFRTRAIEAAAAYEARQEKLREAYLANLTQLQTTLTKKGRMEKARDVNAEIKRVQAAEEPPVTGPPPPNGDGTTLRTRERSLVSRDAT